MGKKGIMEQGLDSGQISGNQTPEQPKRVDNVGEEFMLWAERAWAIDLKYNNTPQDENQESSPYSFVREVFVEKINELNELNKGIPKKIVIDESKVIKPLPRIIREGTIGTCPKCHSTELRKYGSFGKVVGCINYECDNYFRN